MHIRLKVSVLLFVLLIPFQYVFSQVLQEECKWINIIDDRCVYDKNSHAAFTTLEQWKGHLWVAFREGENHNETADSKGVIRIQKKSIFGWNTQDVLSKKDDDLRDPQFLKIKDTLFLYTSNYYSQLINDEWTALKPIKHYSPYASCIWKKRTYNKEIYGVGKKWGKWPMLMKSVDGINWHNISEYRIGGNASEADLVFVADTMYICLRIDTPIGSNSLWGKSICPFTECQWRVMDVSIASPEMLLLSDETFMLAGREYNYHLGGDDKAIFVSLLILDKYGNVIGRQIIDRHSADQGYPSLAKGKGGNYYMSYYTGDENHSSIRLITFKVDETELTKHNNESNTMH